MPKKGNIPWNKSKKGLQVSNRKGKTFEEIYGIEKSNKIKKTISMGKKGKKVPNRKTGYNVSCAICNREFYVIPSLFGKKKTCSKKCFKLWKSNQAKELNYGKWMKGRNISKESILKREKLKALKRKEIGYVSPMRGKPSWNKGIPHTEEHKKKLKYKRGFQVTPVKDTSIEVKMQNLLKKNNVKFEKHKYIKNIKHGYQCDVFVPSKKLVIECDGDYWHKRPFGNPLDIIRSNELRAKGYKLLRFWESEIKPMKSYDLMLKLNKIPNRSKL